MKDLRIRLAEKEDALKVKALITAVNPDGRFEDVDFSDLHPYWLLAENGRGAIGCIQMCPGRPIGRMEMLAVHDGLTHQQRAHVVKRLTDIAMVALKQQGSQYASGVVPFTAKSWKKVIKRRGGEVVSSGNLMMRRLA